MPSTAEHESWGEAIDEMVICGPSGMVGVGILAYRCTGGHHVGPGQFIRCISRFHGPAAPDPAARMARAIMVAAHGTTIRSVSPGDVEPVETELASELRQALESYR